MRSAILSWGLAALLAVAAPHAASARSLQQVLLGGTLRVGVALYVPWAARTANGDLIGFEVDVAKRLASDMGLKVEILSYDIGRLIPALESGEIDLIAAGLAIRPDRALHVNFSEPYAESGIALAAQKKSTADVKSLADLDNERYTIAAIGGSVAAEFLSQFLPHAKLRAFENADAASAALIDGKVDGYLEDEPVPTFLALENPDKIDVPLDRPLLVSKAGFAVNKGDPDFLAFLNAWIVSHEADTWLPTTTNYWFKTLRWKDKLDAPATPSTPKKR
ncbi:MAG TPA: transporter substrate-binding domain-containing protein [Gammaproteobacteria bacterium]|nr:transporter substrate-binding domain-containing protein [Gammaproteobacteria bacterium]